MNKFVKDRHDAFVSAIIDDKRDKVIKYAKKYGAPIPKTERAMKAGVYKAAQYCTDIDEETKAIARAKCIGLGMSPYIDWEEK